MAANRRGAREASQAERALRTTKWGNFLPAPGAAGHRWHSGTADHQRVELVEPVLRGAADLGEIWLQSSKFLNESYLDNACPRFLLKGNSD